MKIQLLDNRAFVNRKEILLKDLSSETLTFKSSNLHYHDRCRSSLCRPLEPLAHVNVFLNQNGPIATSKQAQPVQWMSMYGSSLDRGIRSYIYYTCYWAGIHPPTKSSRSAHPWLQRRPRPTPRGNCCTRRHCQRPGV